MFKFKDLIGFNKFLLVDLVDFISSRLVIMDPDSFSLF